VRDLRERASLLRGSYTVTTVTDPRTLLRASTSNAEAPAQELLRASAGHE
jgi:hypothetical protein